MNLHLSIFYFFFLTPIIQPFFGSHSSIYRSNGNPDRTRDSDNDYLSQAGSVDDELATLSALSEFWTF